MGFSGRTARSSIDEASVPRLAKELNAVWRAADAVLEDARHRVPVFRVDHVSAMMPAKSGRDIAVSDSQAFFKAHLA